MFEHAFAGPGHVSLPVLDLERSRRFYQDVLGMRVIARDDRMILLAAGDALEIALNKAERRSTATGLIHFGFRERTLAEVERWEEHLRRQDVQNLDLVRSDGACQLYFCDPDGWQVEIYAYDASPARERSRESDPAI